jgi:hypothetical protein
MAMEVSRTAQVTAGRGQGRVIGPSGPTWWLSAALAVAAAAGSLLTFTVPAVLRGTAVMNGSARGTALVVLLAGVPTLAGSMLLAARGSVIARCTSAADVAAAIGFARGRQLELSVRGGAHGTAGTAVCDGGLMIDLTLLDAVTVDPGWSAIPASAG